MLKFLHFVQIVIFFNQFNFYDFMLCVSYEIQCVISVELNRCQHKLTFVSIISLRVIARYLLTYTLFYIFLNDHLGTGQRLRLFISLPQV